MPGGPPPAALCAALGWGATTIGAIPAGATFPRQGCAGRGTFVVNPFSSNPPDFGISALLELTATVTDDFGTGSNSVNIRVEYERYLRTKIVRPELRAPNSADDSPVAPLTHSTAVTLEATTQFQELGQLEYTWLLRRAGAAPVVIDTGNPLVWTTPPEVANCSDAEQLGIIVNAVVTKHVSVQGAVQGVFGDQASDEILGELPCDVIIE